MSHSKSRRIFLKTLTAAGGALGAVALTGGCSKDELTCTDTSSLTATEQATRTNLAYVDTSPHGETKDCANCNFYTAAGENQCGTCTLMKGPINPKGYCNSWAAKQA